MTSHAPQAITELTFDLPDLSHPRTQPLVGRVLRASEAARTATCPLEPKRPPRLVSFHLSEIEESPPSTVFGNQDHCKTWVVKNHSCHQLSLMPEADRRTESKEATGEVLLQASLLWHSWIPHPRDFTLSKCPLIPVLFDWFGVLVFRQSLGSQAGFELVDSLYCQG